MVAGPNLWTDQMTSYYNENDPYAARWLRIIG